MDDGAMWNHLFQMAEESEKTRIAEKNSGGRKKYRYLGEIDCPEELYSYTWVPVELIQSNNFKINWFAVSDGTYFPVSDFGVDALLMSGDCQSALLPIEEERNTTYKNANIEGRIKFRMDIQHMPYNMAREFVYHEAGMQPYEYQYVCELTETCFNSYTKESETFSFRVEVEADTDDEAIEKASAQRRSVGDMISRGVIYQYDPEGKAPRKEIPYTEVVTSADTRILYRR